MRPFLLVLLLGWVSGLSLGVFGIDPVVVGLLGLAVALYISRLGMHPSLAVAVLMLILLGFIWQYQVQRDTMLEACEILDGSVGTVTGTPDRLTDRLRVVVTFSDCRALVSISPFTAVNAGDVVAVRGGRISYLADVREWSVGYASYLSHRDISATWQWPVVEVVTRHSSVLVRVHGVVREHIIRLFPEPDASIVLAMLLAERGMLPEYIVTTFRATGVSHVLAISGLHVSMLVGLLAGFLLLFPIGPWWRTLITLTMLWLYLLLIGGPASAVRASMFWTILLVALRLHALVSLPTALVLTTSVLVTWQPRIVFDVGFQLSVSAVSGIFLALFLVRGVSRVQKGPMAGVISLALVSLGAGLATGPLAAYHFGTTSFLGVVSNMLVVPVVGPLLFFAIVATGLSFFSIVAAHFVTLIVHMLLFWMLWVTSLLAHFSGLYLQDISISLWQVGVYYAFFVVLARWLVKRQGRSWIEVWEP